MKIRRQDIILELITKNEIETQDELIERLNQLGIFVTQATISRDIRDLKITKKPGEHGKYRYTMVTTPDTSRFNSVLIESIRKIDYAQNNVIVKTHPGLASAVAAGIDSVNLPEIVGCVAGDDTIIIVTRSEKFSMYVSDKLRELIAAV